MCIAMQAKMGPGMSAEDFLGFQTIAGVNHGNWDCLWCLTMGQRIAQGGEVQEPAAACHASRLSSLLWVDRAGAEYISPGQSGQAVCAAWPGKLLRGHHDPSMQPLTQRLYRAVIPALSSTLQSRISSTGMYCRLMETYGLWHHA